MLLLLQHHCWSHSGLKTVQPIHTSPNFCSFQFRYEKDLQGHFFPVSFPDVAAGLFCDNSSQSPRLAGPSRDRHLALYVQHPAFCPHFPRHKSQCIILYSFSEAVTELEQQPMRAMTLQWEGNNSGPMPQPVPNRTRTSPPERAKCQPVLAPPLVLGQSS